MAEPAYPRTFPASEDGESWPARGEWTYEEFLRLPEDGNRYEVIRGFLYVTPPPTPEHQFTSFELSFHLSSFVRANGLGLVLAAPLGIKLPSGIATPVQPDVVFFRKGNEPQRGTSYYEGVPDLIAEVLSPRTRRRDGKTKLEAYQEAGVSEYWLSDPDARTVVVYSLKQGKYIELVRGGEGDVVGSAVLPGFEVKVSELFMP